MPRSTSPNPYALLDSVQREIGKIAILAYLNHAPAEMAEAAENARLRLPTGPRKRKKRADAGKPRGPRKLKKAKAAAKAAAPPASKPPSKPKPKRAKPRVDPLTTAVTIQEGAI